MCLKCTKISLAAALCPDPLGELMLSPDLVAAMAALTSKGVEGREGRREDGKGEEGIAKVKVSIE